MDDENLAIIMSSFWLIIAFVTAVTHVFLYSVLGAFTTGIGFIFKSALSDLFLFGKLKQASKQQSKHGVFTKSGGPLLAAFQNLIGFLSSIPKRWFSHFYFVGLLFNVPLTGVVLYILLNKNVSTLVIPVSAWHLVTVLCLFLVQLIRRLYECLFVSSFSNGTMSFVHYAFGLLFYAAFGIGLVTSSSWSSLTINVGPANTECLMCLAGVLTFSVASYFQHKTMRTFARLRTFKKDKGNSGHYVPFGHMFDLVSSPHYLCEIVIYLSFNLICLPVVNIYLLSTSLFVLANQISAGLSVHRWYKHSFSHYPPRRKAVIPYLL